MDRLTRTGQDFENEFCSGCDCVYYGEPNGCNHPDGNCGSYTYFTLVADRLAEYEDTGLSPAEVAELAQAKAEGRLHIGTKNDYICAVVHYDKYDSRYSFALPSQWYRLNFTDYEDYQEFQMQLVFLLAEARKKYENRKDNDGKVLKEREK
jgi:hypothetical protein